MKIKSHISFLFELFVLFLLIVTIPKGFVLAVSSVSPIVTTGASSPSIETASISLSVTDTGSNIPTEIGVEYGETTGYGLTKSETGSYTSGYSYVSEFGQAQSMNGADDIVVDSSGNIYVSDYGNVRVLKFNSSGVFQTQFGSAGNGAGQFNAPNAMAIDSSNNIYVNDYPNSRIQIFNSDGVYQGQVAGTGGSGDGELNSQYGFEFDSLGNLYVADWGNARVQKFNSAGVYQSQFGSAGSGNGQFSYPADIAFDSSGNIYVSDYGNNRVQKFNSAGVYQSQFGSVGSGNGQFSNPYGIDIDSLGNIYIADDNSIQVFNSSGVYQSRISGAVGDFVITPSDTMYISYNNLVNKFSKVSGNYTIHLSGLNCGTTYHYRAYATSLVGTGNGSDASFTTDLCPRTTFLIPSAPISIIPPVVPVVSTPIVKTSIVKPFLKNLRKGVVDEDVILLQLYLDNHNFPVALSGPGSLLSPTTRFGSATASALAKFQKSVNLPASGYFGPLTREYINNHL